MILQYQAVFLNVIGHQLLNFRADDLDNLGIKKLGHQEIILEAVEHLRHFVSQFHQFFILLYELYGNATVGHSGIL